MKKKKAKAPDPTLIGKFEVAGGKIWVRNYCGLAVWVEPRSVNPAFSEEMRRWRKLVAAKRKSFSWKVDKDNAERALVLLCQMVGHPGNQ